MPEAERDHAITLTRAGKCCGEGLTSPVIGRNDDSACNLQQKGYHKSETGKSGNSHRLLTTTLIGGKRMAINHVTFFLSGINHKASNALTSSACSSLQ